MKAITIDDAKIQPHLSEVVRSTVHDTPTALLDEESDRLCVANSLES